jgi:trk system potassium uptake protein TrkA
MYIMVVGGGRVGYHLAKALLNAGHEVFILEKEARKVREFRDELGNIAMAGDGSEPAALEEAGAARADVFIATTGSDEDNLAACQMARHRFHVKRTIALVNDTQNEALLRLLGVDVAVSSTQAILAQIEEELPDRPPVRVMPVRGGREVLSVEIPPEAAAARKTLEELDLPEDTTISAIVSRDGFLKPLVPNTTLEAYDEVVALTTADSAEALLELLAREE